MTSFHWRPTETGRPFSDEQLDAVEQAARYELPPGYRSFIKEHGAVFVGGSIDGNEDFPIDWFSDFEDVWMTLLDGTILPDDIAASFANCILGNYWVFDRTGAIHYLDYYSRNAIRYRVASDFGEFMRRIVINED